MKLTFLATTILFFFISLKGLSQHLQDSVPQSATLNYCIQYALKHQPLIQQALIDEKITEETIRTKLADWYPQLNLNANYQNNIQLGTSYFNGNYVNTGTHNVSGLNLGATQNIFNRDVLLASRTAADVRKGIREITDSSRIGITAGVGKAFYDVLLTQKQIDVLDENIIRLNRSLKDAYNQYKGGIVDKTDYKRATIALNNTSAQRKQGQGVLTAKYFVLKQLMGYPDSAALQLNYDSTLLEEDIQLDTLQQINYDNRIEYKLLQTQKSLQSFNLKYYKWGFLPSISAFGNYNLNYFNNNIGKLYSRSFPNSNIGLQLSFPIFQGFKRIHQIRSAGLQLDRIDLGIVFLKSRIATEYAQALALYKGNLANYIALKDNVQLANDVYTIIRLQYQQGIKTYLEVIIAENDLQTSNLNYYTALFQLLQSKIDVQKALGVIQY
ncbi:MAG: TolC family protein [Chitinophagaceae bacterium]|nr:TolC family protein [Chitinophagaceae bacterium]